MAVARVSDGRVHEVWPSREAMADKFHPDFIAGLVDIPDDVEAGYWQTGNGWSATEPKPPPTVNDFSSAIQGHVDGVAQSKGYADGVALAGYASSTVPAWALEAQTFIAWRDFIWVYAYGEFAKVQIGQRKMPTIADLLAELPVIEWPEGN